MGKVTATSNGNLEESIGERIKKRKRRKDLEEIRRNVLAAKRNLQTNKPTNVQKPKTNLMKCLNEFSKQRSEVENAIQCQNSLLISSGKNNDHNYDKQQNPTQNRETRDIIDQLLPKPLSHKGFFRAGIKGKFVTRPLGTEERKFKNAVLQGDALQIFQSGGFCSQYNNNKNPSQDNLNTLAKKEISKFLKNSSESSCEEDNSSLGEVITYSPVLGRNKSTKKKVNAVKSNADRAVQSISHTQAFIIKNTTKEERCKRRLFEEENTTVNNNNSICSINGKSDLVRKSTPENEIYFTEHVVREDVNNKLTEKHNDHKITDPQLIKCYIQTCKLIAEKNFKNIFQNITTDPMESAKVALKMTYTNTFKTYLQHQNRVNSEKYHKMDQKTVSTYSEIMMEPDSAIARTIKKNKQLQARDNDRSSENNSDASSIHNLDTLQAPYVLNLDSIVNNATKRKYVSSSKGEPSDVDVPSSTKVNTNPKSARIELKMDAIHPERQELIARYLKDVITNKRHEDEVKNANKPSNSEKEYNSDNFEKEKLFENDNKKTYFVHKNAKHVPAILRKSRALADCVAKEKVSLSLEKSQRPNELFSKFSIQDFNTNKNIMSEHTPDCGNLIANQSMEAPKCKYTYMNAKYNQPSRIHVPMMQAKRCLRNTIPERKNLFASPQHTEIDKSPSTRISVPVMKTKVVYRNIVPEKKNLLMSPSKNIESDFILSQKIVLSPIEENKYNFHNCQLSQESAKQEGDCMVPMVSFSDIQERTDRLTLHSSQSQICSQESIDKMYSSQENCYNSHPDIYYQQCDTSNNCANYINRPRVTFNNVPTSRSFDAALNTNYNLHSYNSTHSDENPSYNSQHNYQVVLPKIYPSQGTKDFNYCLFKERQVSNKQIAQSTKSCMSPVQMQQQNLRQPIKFVAVEGNRLPQRHPIYNMNDGNTCSHVHKISIPNQLCNQAMKSCYSRDALNRPCYAKASIRFGMQGVPESAPNSEFKIKTIHKFNNMVPTNLQRTLNSNSENPGPSRGMVNYVSSNMSDPPFITQHADANNQRYIKHQLSPQLYSEVEYRHNHCNNNEVYKINDVTYRR